MTGGGAKSADARKVRSSWSSDPVTGWLARSDHDDVAHIVKNRKCLWSRTSLIGSTCRRGRVLTTTRDQWVNIHRTDVGTNGRPGDVQPLFQVLTGITRSWPWTTLSTIFSMRCVSVDAAGVTGVDFGGESCHPVAINGRLPACC